LITEEYFNEIEKEVKNKVDNYKEGDLRKNLDITKQIIRLFDSYNRIDTKRLRTKYKEELEVFFITERLNTI